MKIMISGGTGLVGKEIGKKLAAKGHELFVLTRSKEKAALQCPYPHTAISWDELETSEKILDLDSIINLAGANLTDKRWNKSFKEKIYNSRVKGTRQLVDLANNKLNQLSSFVSTSAIGIYGATDNALVSEEHQKSYGFLGKVCQDWEAPVSDLKKARGVILRLGIVFSEKGGALAEMSYPIQNRIGGALAGGNQYMSWIDIEDLANMFIFAIENPISGTFNATAPNPETNKIISQTIADHLGVWLAPSVPYFALRMVVGEMAPHLIESQKISPEKIQNKGFQFQFKKVTDSIKARVPLLKGTEKRFIYEQWVPKKKEEVFEFFSQAKNLEKITPPSLQFNITSVSTEAIQKNTEINYKLKVDGIPIKWKTIIKDWQPPQSFSDFQEKGPYKKWYHVHEFADLAHGTLMTDRIDIVLPLGPVGYLFASWKVLKDVRKIFAYRKETIYKMYYK